MTRRYIKRVCTALELSTAFRLEKLAAANHVTPSAYMRAIIVDALNEEEDSGRAESVGDDCRGLGEIPLA